MDEYIERQKLYNNLVLLAKYETGERQQGILGCAETVRIFPAADVAPVRHGKWENGNPICPVCGGNKFRDLDADIWCDWQPDFCPNCGAKMDGGCEDA